MTNKPLIRNTTPPGLKEVQMVVADIIGAEPQTGLFYDPSTLAYEITLGYTLTSPARTLTITPTGSTWRAWVNGVMYTFTGAQTIQHAATQGLWYIYVDNTGTIVASQTLWNLLYTAPIALIYYDATTPDYWMFDERHTYLFPSSCHEHDHFSIGTFVKNPATDFTIGGYTLGTDTDGAVQWSMTSGTACDEDIEKLLTAVSSGGPYQVMYRSGVNGYFIRSQVTLPYVYAAASYIQWNQLTGGSWQLTAMTSANRINYYVFATTGYDGAKQLMIIPGQAFYSSLAAAQAESVTSLNLTGFPALEFVPLYQITFHTLAGYSHNGKCEIEAVTKITSNRATLSLAAPTFTNPMTTLGDIIAGDAGGAPTRVAGNTAASQKFLAQTGDGANSALPGWVTPSALGDMLSALLNVESTISGVSSPTTFDTMYLCSGSSYTISLPTSLTGKKNSLMGFRMDPGLTGMVTLDAGAGHLIDGQRYRLMRANEVALLKANTDETNWTKIAGKTIPLSSSIGFSTNQTFNAATYTLLTWSTSLSNDGPSAQQDLANYKLVIQRPGKYIVTMTGIGGTNNGSANRFFCEVYKNGADQFLNAVSLAANQNQEVVVSLPAPTAYIAGDYLQPYGYYSAGLYATTVFYNDSANPIYNMLSILEVPTW